MLLLVSAIFYLFFCFGVQSYKKKREIQKENYDNQYFFVYLQPNSNNNYNDEEIFYIANNVAGHAFYAGPGMAFAVRGRHVARFLLGLLFPVAVGEVGEAG
jgi:hypothetical protein